MIPNDLVDAIASLRCELELSSSVNDDVLKQARELDAQVHAMISSNELRAEESLNDQFLALEAEFAKEHPILENLTRDVINKLAQMGI